MLIFDFFAGTGSSTQAFANAGDVVITFELDEQFSAARLEGQIEIPNLEPEFAVTETINILNLTSEYLLQKYGRPDFVWASPPCTAFSVASIGHHWLSGGDWPVPKTEEAVFNQKLVEHTRKLCEELNPRYGFLIENPRGMLRKLPALDGLTRRTISYCQYGDTRQKPTDLWGDVPNWSAREMCGPGDDCHEAAPRGSKTGTQGLSKSKFRSMIPFELAEDLRAAIIKTIELAKSSVAAVEETT